MPTSCYVGGPSPVKVGGTTGRNLLLALRGPEEGGALQVGPGEQHIGHRAVCGSDCVLECAIVEDGGGELGQHRVHAVLDHEADGTNTEQNKTLKERLGQSRPASGREGGRRGRVKERGISGTFAEVVSS